MANTWPRVPSTSPSAYFLCVLIAWLVNVTYKYFLFYKHLFLKRKFSVMFFTIFNILIFRLLVKLLILTERITKRIMRPKILINQ